MGTTIFTEERHAVADYMRRLYDRGLTTPSGGNISLRVDKNHFLITPSALDKGRLVADQIAVVTIEGKNLTEHLRLSIETEMHRLILISRPDAGAVVHAHPTYASAFTAIRDGGNVAINTHLIAESYYILEDPVFVDYRLMGTVDLAEQVAVKAFDHDVLLLENHGVVTIGTSLLDAFDKIELLERASEMTVIARTMERLGSEVSPLEPGRLAQLMRMKYGPAR
ncbi:MAG TPA: class II aldolase/adducin family protein [Sphaerochaeta sp.]|jgi:L-fuculose-phosphate aldolase|nr:class II aldolase/adducin family protein [Sphaerochaeta sp.]